MERQLSFWDDQRMTHEDAIELSISRTFCYDCRREYNREWARRGDGA